MIKKISVIVGTIALLSACVTPYQDPRSPEEKAEQFTKSMEVLWGDYRVLDSRNNNQKFVDVSIQKSGDSVFAEFIDAQGRVMTINGGNCGGGYRANDNYAYFFCTNKFAGNHISMITMRTVFEPMTVPAGGGLFGHKEMKIEKGYHLNFTLGNNGRQHQFALEKKK